jgi:hypothetical protein
MQSVMRGGLGDVALGLSFIGVLRSVSGCGGAGRDPPVVDCPSDGADIGTCPLIY